MEDVFIQQIKVNKARNLVNFEIPLDLDTKKNLIITGKNGSGKTSLLIELKKFLNQTSNDSIESYEPNVKRLQALKIRKEKLLKDSNSTEEQIDRIDSQIKNYQFWIDEFGGTIIQFNKPKLVSSYFQRGDFIIAFFEAKRNTNLKVPSGINLIDIKPVYKLDESARTEFIQHMVNLKADRSFAKDDNDLETVEKIDEWFRLFEENIYKLFDSSSIKLKFDRKLYNFYLFEDGKEPYNLNQLAAGYSAILSIITELIMRMEVHRAKNYDVQGVVLIDELETHLHIELQKRILPFLTSFFPKIQFIVTTHSPFVLSSIENSVICDLEKKIVTNNLSGYSYDTLIESYFNSDKYSLILQDYIKEYEELLDRNNNLKESEKDRLLDLKKYINEIPKFISDELAVKIQQIKLKELNKRKKK